MPKQVIFIMTDTQRKDMLDCYGGENMITPNLDRLASSGVRFDRAYTAQPVCGPARSCIFTGTYPHTNGSIANGIPLLPSAPHIGNYLARHRIPACYIGKWHLDGGDYFGYGKCPQDFDEKYWYDMRCYLEELTPSERQKSRKTATIYDDPIDESFTFADRCVSRAVGYIEENRQSDFFLTVSLDEPHGPFLCPRKFVDMHRDHCFRKRPNFMASLEQKPEHQKIWSKGFRFPTDDFEIRAPEYFGCNTFADYEIGRVIDAVKENLSSDALIIYTADHGDMLYSHSLMSKGPFMYDEATNVPLLMSGGGISAGIVNTMPVGHVDLLPTVFEYFGIDAPSMLEGESILKEARSGKTTERTVFMEFSRYEIDHDSFCGFQPIRACFDGRYKLVVNLLSSDEFYDLKSDPYEIDNRIYDAAFNAEKDRLLHAIVDEMNRTRDVFRGYIWSDRDWHTPIDKSFYGEGMTRQRSDENLPRQLDYDNGLAIRQFTRKKF